MRYIGIELSFVKHDALSTSKIQKHFEQASLAYPGNF